MTELDSQPPLLVLGFHHVDDDLDDYTSMRRAVYDELIDALAARFRLCTLRSVLTEPVAGGLPPLVLTFDDAYASILAPALAGAARYGALGTVYVISGYIGQANAWNRKCGYWAAHLGADGIADLLAAGFELGSHTCEHYRLPKLPGELLTAELRDSKARLEDEFSVAVDSLAYPYGYHDGRVRQAATAHYGAAVSTTTKASGSHPVADRYALRRLMVTRAMTAAEIVTEVDRLRSVRA